MTASIRVALAGVERAGEAVDLSDRSVAPSRVVAAVRAPDGAVDCPRPGPVHERVGLVGPAATAPGRRGLAAAARSRGWSAPQAERLACVREELADLDADPPDATAARRQLASAGEDVDRLRERVAALRGRVQALRGTEDGAGSAEAALREAVATLAEVETERTAAEQRLERARAERREALDARDRRLRLEDRAANLERAARAHLADRIRPRVDAAACAVPGGRATRLDDAAPVTAALAVLRVARIRAPVVLACRRFPDAPTAAAWLDAPVVRL